MRIMKCKSFLAAFLFFILSLGALSEPTKFFFSPVKNEETRKAGKNLKKNGYFDQIIYTANESHATQFLKMVRDGDIVEFHAEGLPWLAGGEGFKPQIDKNPITLAKYFADLLTEKRDLALTIDLRFCNSGTLATGHLGNFRFGEFFSKALAKSDLHHITVWSYSGYINSKSLFHQSVTELGDNLPRQRGAKASHCNLEQGRLEFKDGVLMQPALKKPLETYDYDPVLNDHAPSNAKLKQTLEKFFEDAQALDLPLNR